MKDPKRDPNFDNRLYECLDTAWRLGIRSFSILQVVGVSFGLMVYLPLVSREWKNGSSSSYNCTPFLHSLLTKGKFKNKRRALRVPREPNTP